MKKFIAKRTRFIVMVLVVAMALSGGVAALAMSSPVSLPIFIGNVAGDVYSDIDLGDVNVNVEVVTVTVTTLDSEEADELLAAIYNAVEDVADDLAAATGKVLRSVGLPMEISVEAPNTVALFRFPAGTNAAEVTTLAMFTADGTLIPVPTRIDAQGNVRVLVSGDAILVPLNVEANFTDIEFGAAFVNVTDEINRAASMMIIQGRGAGVFAPTVAVTAQDAATMFLRSMGVEVDWATAMSTAAEVGLADSNLVGSAPLSRIQTAVMLTNALTALGHENSLSPEAVDVILADFTDVDNLTAAQRMALAVTVELGIFRGAGDGLMNPTQVLQRSAVASLSVRLQDVFLGV